MKIYPAILSKNSKKFQEKIELTKKFPVLHIDVMDKKFTANKTLSLKQLLKTPQKQTYSFHLMLLKPEEQIPLLKQFKTKEVFIHYEAVKYPEQTIEDFKKNKINIGLAWNPETKIIHELAKKTNSHLIMTVNPGYSGQKFLEKNLTKIKTIKKYNPNAIIMVDGGINFNTIEQVKKYEPNIIIVASGIFKGNVEENIKKWNTIL
ncbi:hypothetical protein COV11_00245 [Candidatus Woesearchaeota archaeon CG10_big_fil_rev_8_21_14_0_10_30_7]|nr:MAG: hypothetical protein COV11_00245 [Candidatus Woesearchaeota archaeon CG10_big_fil_rev_8_21_14_0_10_30_7]